MSWQLEFRSDRPFGSADEVANVLSSSQPSIQWERYPSRTLGFSKRRTIASAVRVGKLIHGKLTIRFILDTEPIERIRVEVFGTGNPIPILVTLCDRHQWKAIDRATGDVIDLITDGRDTWNNLCNSMRIDFGTGHGTLRPTVEDVIAVLDDIESGIQSRPEFAVESAVQAQGKPAMHIAAVQPADEVLWIVTVNNGIAPAVLSNGLSAYSDDIEVMLCGAPAVVSAHCLCGREKVTDAVRYFLSYLGRSPLLDWMPHENAVKSA